jgi:PPM family protein phosphatase
MLDVEFSQFSDPGTVRTHNEDYLGYVQPSSPAEVRAQGWLFVLADGVGGQRQGEVASRAAVQEILGGFRRSPASAPPKELLSRLVRSANARVCETEALAGPAGTGMSSTVVACALRFDRATVAHVGDSRCYLIRGDRIRQITHDHTVAAEHVRLRLLSVEEAREASTRHVLSRSLGSNLFVNVEINDVQLVAGDVLVLCSDGLYGAISDAEIESTVSRTPDLEKAARDLVDTANRQDGSDNVSVQLVRIRSVERMGIYRGRPYKLR